MSERMTSIDLPGVSNSGYADWDRKSVPEMLQIIRARAVEMRRVADAIMGAADADFHVETYRGVYVRRERKVLQEGRR